LLHKKEKSLQKIEPTWGYSGSIVVIVP